MMGQHNFAKYLPTPHGGKALATLSQRAVYALWRADLIRFLEGVAKQSCKDVRLSESTSLPKDVAITTRRRGGSFPQATSHCGLKMRRGIVFNKLKSEKVGVFLQATFFSRVASLAAPNASLKNSVIRTTRRTSTAYPLRAALRQGSAAHPERPITPPKPPQGLPSASYSPKLRLPAHLQRPEPRCATHHAITQQIRNNL